MSHSISAPEYATQRPAVMETGLNIPTQGTLLLQDIFCVAFSGADIEFDIVLMTSVYSQYFRDSCRQHLALVGS